MKTTGQSKTNRRDGFTMVEVLMGLFVFITVSGGALWGLNQLNYYASVNRLYTAAQTLAQNHIDLFLTKGPYNPTLSQVPEILKVQTRYWDQYATGTGSASAIQVPLYYYKTNGDTGTQVTVVNGTIQTTVANQTGSIGGTNLNLRKASVTVTYTFRNKTFNVKMDTIRAPDA